MKKLFLFLLFLGVTGMVCAQSEIVIGPKFGLNATNISNSEGKNKASIHLGGFATTKLSERIALQVELLYSRQGWRDKGHIEGDKDVKLKARVNYLNIPVMARFYVLDKFSVDLGPQLGLALNAKAKAKYGSTTVKEKIDDLNTVDLTFGMGLSYDLDMGFTVSARYNLGITNVFDKDKTGVTNTNRVFQLSLGYRFSL